MATVPKIEPHRRLSGPARADASDQLLQLYEGGKSIRQLCAETGYSIGRVRRLLQEAGVTYRSRGGSRGRALAGRRGSGRSGAARPSETAHRS